MVERAAVFFALAILAAGLGFAGVGAAAKVLLVVFLVLAGISLLRGRSLVA
jgi:uncharacterized membrane protein YtjA (UPF0391 family)